MLNIVIFGPSLSFIRTTSSHRFLLLSVSPFASIDDLRHIVSKVTPGGLSEGAIEVGDEILAVNGENATNLPHDKLVELMCSLMDVRLLIRRPMNSDGSWPVKASLGRTQSGKMQISQQDSTNNVLAVKRYAQHQQSIGRNTPTLQIVVVDVKRDSLETSFGFSMGSTGMRPWSQAPFDSDRA